MDKICRSCQKPFEAKHGNKQYCDDVCRNAIKSKRQIHNNSLLKQFRKGFLSNHRQFKQLLPESGSLNIPLHSLLKDGFDQHAYYGSKKDDDNRIWQQVNEYYFCISKKGNQITLTIYKP